MPKLENVTMEEIARYLSQKLWETPVGWYREVGIREEEDGYTLTYLTESMTKSTFTSWTPEEPQEVKFAIEPCPDRGTTCDQAGTRSGKCTKECFLECTSQYLADEKIPAAFADAYSQ